jgi:predicted N-acetyltransferase YhbS
MEGPRAPADAEFNAVIDFLNTNLRPGQAWSVADEYPTALTPNNISNFRIIKEDQKILSHALVKPTFVKTRRGLFKVACIGSVVTSSEHRNQGLSHTVLKDCLAAATNQGCDIALLWSNLYDFYARLGFELAGQEISLLVDKPIVPAKPSEFRIVATNRVDVQALYRIYSQHTVSSIRTPEDFEKYLKIPNCRLYTAWDTTGLLRGYAVEGKGADLQGYIHEWGGSVEALIALFNHIRTQVGKPVTVISPGHATNLIQQMTQAGCKKVEGFLGFVKITNFDSLAQKIIRNARLEWGIEDFVLEKRDGYFYYGVGEDLLKTDHEGDIVRLLFGPHKPSQLFDGGEKLNAVLDRVFPIEMWIWGWDSV